MLEKYTRNIDRITARLMIAQRDGDINRIGGAEIDLDLAREQFAYHSRLQFRKTREDDSN